MRLLSVFLIAPLAACGRIGFDPLDDSTSSGLASPLVWLTMDDPQGTAVLHDESGNRHQATCVTTACPQIEPGIHGTAAHFDGADFAAIEHTTDLDVTTMSIAAWVRLDTTPLQFVQIASRQLGSANDDTWVFGYRGTSTDAGAPYQVAMTTTTESAMSLKGQASTPDVGTWIHLAATYDGAIERLYRNGTEMMTRPLTGSIVPGPTRIMIGAADNGAALVNEYLTGSIDDLRIYATALPAEDIAALAAAP